MSAHYLIGIDQSTQGTKALLFDQTGALLRRCDRAHRQIVGEQGWISHDPQEIYQNTVAVVQELVTAAGIDKTKVVGVGISNQRETSLAWHRDTGEPVADAVVWQCARAADIAERVEAAGHAEVIRQKTGLKLSPYFPAAKIAWLLENIPGAKALAAAGKLCHGTMDSWLVFKLTGGNYKTDYSNASRTQLFNIFELKWDRQVCAMFGISPANMAEVCDSDSNFGTTDFEGFFPAPLPIHAVLGDSHGALFGQGCRAPGMMKTTYGTGSSIMMNIGETPVLSQHGVVTSLAWGLSGRVNYCLEGNINYTGAVISWLKDEVGLIDSPAESEDLCRAAAADDELYFVPAFTGLGAPYWDSRAKGSLTGITRTTKRAEIVRAGIECIAYQITDIIRAMCRDSGLTAGELRVDGGPTRNKYLMQFQSDLADTRVLVPDAEELSGIGAAYAAGLRLGLFDEQVFERIHRQEYGPKMDAARREQKYAGWQAAVHGVLTK